MLGFLVGLATGYAIGASTENTDFQGLYGLLGGMAGVALGVPTGAIIGNQIGGACWREIAIGRGSSGNVHPEEPEW